MSVSTIPFVKPHWHDDNSNPAVGWKLYSFISGTDTPHPLYKDASGLVEHPNPLTLNSRGEPDGDGAFLEDGVSYKLILKREDTSTAWSLPLVTGSGSGGGVSPLVLPARTVSGNASNSTAEASALQLETILSNNVNAVPSSAAVVAAIDSATDTMLGNSGEQVLDGSLSVSGTVSAGAIEIDGQNTDERYVRSDNMSAMALLGNTTEADGPVSEVPIVSEIIESTDGGAIPNVDAVRGIVGSIEQGLVKTSFSDELGYLGSKFVDGNKTVIVNNGPNLQVDIDDDSFILRDPTTQDTAQTIVGPINISPTSNTIDYDDPALHVKGITHLSDTGNRPTEKSFVQNIATTTRAKEYISTSGGGVNASHIVDLDNSSKYATDSISVTQGNRSLVDDVNLNYPNTAIHRMSINDTTLGHDVRAYESIANQVGNHSIVLVKSIDLGSVESIDSLTLTDSLINHTERVADGAIASSVVTLIDSDKVSRTVTSDDGKIIRESSEDGLVEYTGYDIIAPKVTADVLAVDITAGATVATGEIAWNDIDKTFDMGLANGSVLQAGQEEFIYAHNISGVTINNGLVVRLTNPMVPEDALHIATASYDNDSAYDAIAVATADIANNMQGYCTVFGRVRNLNTSAFAPMDKLYLGLNGAITNVPPVFPLHKIQIGYCVTSHATEGIIFVEIEKEFAVEDLYNVNLTTPTQGDSLIYENNQWINRNLGAITKEATGFAVPEGITVTYNQGDRTVTLTGANINAYWRSNSIVINGTSWTSPPHPSPPTSPLYLYYDGVSPVWSTTPWSFDTLHIAYVGYDASGVFTGAVPECHGCMPWQAHREFHQTIGCYLGAGGDVSAYTIGSTTAALRRPDISSTTLYDEDLQTILTALTTKQYSISYLTGVSGKTFVDNAADIIPLSGVQPYYNQFTGGAWIQTLMSGNSYACIFVQATPRTADSVSQGRRYTFIQPQAEFSTLAAAQAYTSNSLNAGPESSLASEFTHIAKIIIRYTAGDWSLTEVTKLSGTRISQSSSSGAFLSTITHDATLTGDGTSTSPLSAATALADKVSKTDTATQAIVSRIDHTVANSETMRSRRTSTTVTNGVLTVKQNYAETILDMAAGFGTAEGYNIKDSAGVDNLIGIIKWVRDDVDNSGKYIVQVGNAGVFSDSFTLDKTGVGIFLSGLNVGTNTTSAPILNINGLAGTTRGLRFLTGGAARWQIRASADAESGSNAGSNLIIDAFQDNSTTAPVLTLTRATGGTLSLARPLATTSSRFKQVTSVVTAAGTTVATANDHIVVFTGTTTQTYTLPTASTGREIVVKNRSTGSVTVSRSGSDTIDGGTTSITLTANQATTLVANGSDWCVI